MPFDLLGKSLDELRALAVCWGEPAYRGAQLYHSLYAERETEPARMSALPAAFRRRLAAEASPALAGPVRRFPSADGSVRYLIALADSAESGSAALARPPAAVEAVFMPSEGRQTICVSTQAGCAVNCRFCLTASLGLIRNLTAGEVLRQVLLPLSDYAGRLAPRTNVVFMGQGEPLLNYEPVIAATRILLDPKGMGLAPRHLTLSTSGIIPGIERLAREPVRPKLAVSLNASADSQRSLLMPLNSKYPLRELMDTCRRFPLRSWERLTFEYVLLGGVNDRPEDARRVARLLSGMRAKVNLIPWNPAALPYRTPDPKDVDEFRRILAAARVPVFVRCSRGRDVMAACGQLALLDPLPATLPALA